MIELTDTLKEHGVTRRGYARCTNAIYRPLLGGEAKALRKQWNLPEKAKLREGMSNRQLAATMFAEQLATDNIEETDAQGNTQCERECSWAGSEVAALMRKRKAKTRADA